VVRNVSTRRGLYQCGRDSPLRGETAENANVNLSSTLGKDEKVENLIRKRTHKLIALRFWVGSDVNPLCGLDSGLIGGVVS